MKLDREPKNYLKKKEIFTFYIDLLFSFSVHFFSFSNFHFLGYYFSATFFNKEKLSGLGLVGPAHYRTGSTFWACNWAGLAKKDLDARGSGRETDGASLSR